MSDDIQARLEAARARKAAAESKRPIEDPAVAELAAAEREAIEAEAITKATCELGAEGRFFVVLPTDLGAIIVKRPHSALFRRFGDLESPKHEDVERLAKPCVYWPDRARLDAMLEEQPAILTRLALAVGKLAGVRRDELGAKP